MKTINDICPARDDAQRHVYENGRCVFCLAPSDNVLILKGEIHSIHCPAYTTDALLKRGHVPGQCTCKGKTKEVQSSTSNNNVTFLLGCGTDYKVTGSKEAIEFLNKMLFELRYKKSYEQHLDELKNDSLDEIEPEHGDKE